jgi:general secretion pathway protein L
VLLLEPDQVLQRTLMLPAAADRDLPSLLAFELDRFTPLSAAQAYYATRRDAVIAARLHLTLVCVRREHLHGWLAAYRQHGIDLAVIDALDALGQRVGVNLLPDAGPGRLGQGRRLSLGLAALCLLLTVTAMALLLHNRQMAVAVRAAQVQQQRAEVAQLQALSGELQRAVDSARYLTDLKQAQPARALLLAELSTCLPTDSWLQSLQINPEGQVDLAGLSSNASGLILQMRRCAHLANVQYQGIIQPDPGSGKDRFYLRAQVAKGGGHVAELLSP